MARYSKFVNDDHCIVYVDECDRKEFLGQPVFSACDWILHVCLHLVWIITLPLTWCCSFKVLPLYERTVVYRLGRLLPMKGPGLIYIIPCVDRYTRVDMRMRELKVPPQEVLTIDGALMKVGADVQYRIVDPLAASALIRDLDNSLRASASSVLSSTLGVEKVKFAINDKQFLSSKLQQHMNKSVSQWGVEIGRFELTHACVLKGAGGFDPSAKEDSGSNALVQLIKSFTSGEMSILSPGMPSSPTFNMASSAGNRGEVAPLTQALLSPDDLIQVVKSVLDVDLVRSTQAIFELCVEDVGCQRRSWLVDLRNGSGCVRPGSALDIRDVRITTDTVTFQKIFYEQISPRDAYLSCSLRIDGSISTAMRLEHLVKKLKSLQPSS